MERKIEEVKFENHSLGIKNVAAYARVSSGKDAMLHSLAQQVSYYKEYITNNPNWHFVEVYADEAMTGTKENRDNFQRMLNDARNGKIDIILTKSLSRFARNTVTLLSTIRELKLLGVDIFFEEQNMHTISKDGELLITILASYAQDESRSVSENMKWRIKKNFEEGLPWGAKLYGYTYKDKKLIIIPEEAEIVKRIYSLYLSGDGTNMIARKLNNEGIKTRLGNSWNRSSIRLILSNEYYKGDMCLQKTFRENHITKKTLKNKGELPKYYVEDSHEAIISKEDFDKVQKMFIEKESSFNRTVTKPIKSPFQSMIECSKCGSHYRRKTTPYKHIWLCGTNIDKGISYCNAKQIPEESLFDAANKALGISTFDETLFKDKILKIVSFENHLLHFHFKDGKVVEVNWTEKTRSEAWTPEKREKARQHTLEINKLKKEEQNA